MDMDSLRSTVRDIIDKAPCHSIPIAAAVTASAAAFVGYRALKKRLAPTRVFPPIALRSGAVNGIVVTGASTGIGADAALSLARDGFTVFAGVRRIADGDNLKSKLDSNAKGSIVPIIIDVCKDATIRAAVATVEKAVGAEGLQGLVNNAGVNTRGPMEFQPIDEIRWQFDVNYFGQVAVTQAFLPLIRKAKGRVVNVSSVSGTVATPFQGAYAGSKFALEAFNDSLRRELRPWGIAVICIEPGFIQSEILTKAADEKASLKDKYSATAQRLYGHWFTLDDKVNPKFVGPVSLTTSAITHALTSRTPKSRYMPGNPTFMRMFKYLPYSADYAVDKLLSRRWPGRAQVPQE